jgi:hypothetical protein
MHEENIENILINVYKLAKYMHHQQKLPETRTASPSRFRGFSVKIFIKDLVLYFLEKAKDISKLSLVAKLFIIVCLILKICGGWKREQYLFLKLSNNPWNIMYLNEWYRLFTAPYMFESSFQLCLGLITFIPEYIRYEENWGTASAIINFLSKDFIINIVYIQFEIFLYPMLLDYKIFTWGGYGLFGMTFTYIISRCYEEEKDEEESENGEESRGPSHLSLKKESRNNMHYFLIYFFLVAIVNYGVRFVDIVAIMIGFFTCEVLDPSVLKYKQKSKYTPQETQDEDSNDQNNTLKVEDTENVISPE